MLKIRAKAELGTSARRRYAARQLKKNSVETMKSMFKSKKSADTIETPPSAKASVGSSAWRRRVGESARNKLGLSRHETDEVTGDVAAGVSSLSSRRVQLKEAVKALESAEASERKADARRKDALARV